MTRRKRQDTADKEEEEHN